MEIGKLLFTGRGRIGRRAYWTFVLSCLLVGATAAVLDGLLVGWSADVQPITEVATLALIVPNVFVTAKRLHDTGRSGWWQALPVGVAMAGALAGLAAYLGAGGPSDPFWFVVFAALLATLAAALVTFAWTGVLKGEAGPNRFGVPDTGDRAVAPVAEVFS